MERERQLMGSGTREPVPRTNHRAAGPAARPTSARLGREPSPWERDSRGAPGSAGDSASSWTELRNANPGRGGVEGASRSTERVQARREPQISSGLRASSVRLQGRKCLLRREASVHSLKLSAEELWILSRFIQNVYIVHRLVHLLIFSLA